MKTNPLMVANENFHSCSDVLGWRYGFGPYAKAHYWPDLKHTVCGRYRDGTMDEPGDDIRDYCKWCLKKWDAFYGRILSGGLL